MLKPITTMGKENTSRSKAYSSTRSAFDELPIEEKAFFLLESAAKAVVDGLQEVFDTFSGTCGDAFDGAFNDAFTSANPAKTAGKAKPKPASKATKVKKTATAKKAKTAKKATAAKKPKEGTDNDSKKDS